MKSITHETVIDMLHKTTMIYNYDDKSNKDKQILDGVVPELDTLLEKHHKGRIVCFMTDAETGLHVGVTINDVDKRICLVFRGTYSLRDWNYNLQLNKYCIHNKIRIHQGFCKQLFATNLYYKISNKIQQLINIYPEYKLFITGHSAGGALSTLFGYFLSTDMPEQQINVVSFASPRIGNYEFKCDFGSRTKLKHYRITNRNDIITATPLFKYYHVGEKIYIRSAKTSICCCLNIFDHQTDTYYTNLLNSRW